jgi:acyl-CoA thioester hydrolase
MTERWPDISGRFEGKMHILSVRVYYEDTDFSGAVYHANYLKFCERARSDCLRLLGIHLSEMHGTASFVVSRMVCDFLKPAMIGNLLEVETRFVEFAGARMELTQTVRRSSEKLFEAQVIVALVGGQGRPKRLPPEMTKIFLSRVESAT